MKIEFINDIDIGLSTAYTRGHVNLDDFKGVIEKNNEVMQLISHYDDAQKQDFLTPCHAYLRKLTEQEIIDYEIGKDHGFEFFLEPCTKDETGAFPVTMISFEP